LSSFLPSKARLAGALVALALLASCKASRKPVAVLTAASLARAFGELEEVVEKKHADVDVRLEIGGSQQLCRKLVELGGKADVLAVADYRVIDRICRPSQAEFNIRFATNSIALAHLEHSRHTGDITTESWHEVLLRPEVRLGLVDADAAPIGYRTLLVWELAAAELGQPDLAKKLRARVAREHVAPHEGELLQLLQSRAIDYAFVYRSTAEEHNLKVVQLPAAYNLGAPDRAKAYARVSVPARMKRGQAPRRVVGAPVTYGLTIPIEPPNPGGAEAFVATLLGPAGRRIFKQTGFAPLAPARCDERSKLPAKIRPLTR
jgi:molybdate/tungstate transport system substrate-binding protein